MYYALLLGKKSHEEFNWHTQTGLVNVLNSEPWKGNYELSIL